MSVRILSRVLRHTARKDDGLGMSEILVAMMVFAVIATTAAYGIINSLTLTQRSRAGETAMSLASSDLDQMRLLASANDSGVFSILSDPTVATKTVGGTVYTIGRAVTWQTTTGAIGACGTGAGTLQYKNVTDTVSWHGANGATQTVRVSSAIAPRSNINSDATGTIIVTVIGSVAGQPMPGMKISITPTSGGAALPSAPQNTDSAGCSFGLLVTPGTYNVVASTTGGIDFQENATASKSTVVVAGQNSVVNLTYDLAGTFPLTYPTDATVPTNLPVTLSNSTLPTGSAKYPAASPTGTPSVKAFPYSDGYSIFAGSYLNTTAVSSSSCLDTNPATWSTPRESDGAVGVAPVAVAAGPGTTAASTAVPLGTLSVANIGSLKGKYVTAVTSSTPGDGDPGCNAGQTLSFPVIPAGVTSLTLALPYGTWRLAYGSSSGSTTTALPAGSVGALATISGGVVNSLPDGTTSVTLDPRTVPTP